MSSRRRRAIVVAAVAVVLGVLFLASPARRFVFPARYDVTSIASAPEYKDGARLARARAQPAVDAYPWPPAFQSNATLCGPTSLANVFASFGEPGVTADAVLAGSGKCPLGVCWGGLTLDELAELAERPGYRAAVLRDLSRDELRAHLSRTTDPTRRYVANFDRGPLFGVAGGHHSPIGGWLEREDLVLVLDVNEEFGPWLVKTDRLFSAMDTLDESTKKKRGLLLVERSPRATAKIRP